MSHKRRGLLFAMLSLLSVSVPVFAHHSISSEFDPKRELTVTGVLSGVEWSNPHIVTYVDVKDKATGKVETWSFQGNGPAAYHRAGIYKEEWKIGQTVTATYAPAKDGTKKLGFLKMLKYSDGHALVFRVGGE